MCLCDVVEWFVVGDVVVGGGGVFFCGCLEWWVVVFVDWDVIVGMVVVGRLVGWDGWVVDIGFFVSCCLGGGISWS